MNSTQNIRRRRGPASLWITGLSCALWALQAAPVELTAATEFRTALPGYAYRFPFDHGSHDDFQTEWWYYTGHLRAADGRTFGYQLTFFRRAVAHEATAKNQIGRAAWRGKGENSVVAVLLKKKKIKKNRKK